MSVIIIVNCHVKHGTACPQSITLFVSRQILIHHVCVNFDCLIQTLFSSSTVVDACCSEDRYVRGAHYLVIEVMLSAMLQVNNDTLRSY